MQQTTINVEMKLKTNSLKEADSLVKNMLKHLEFEDLNLIESLKTSKTMAEIEVCSDVFNKDGER